MNKVNFRQVTDCDSVCRGIVLRELVRTPRKIYARPMESPKLCVDSIPLKDTRGQQKRPLRVLSLDGGGVRGLSSLIILRKIMTKLEDRKTIPKGTAPWQYFDMIGGTSTGGLIALLLGRLKMTINECIDIYMDLARDIFGKAKGLQTATMFSSTKLEETINKAIQMKLEGGHQKLSSSCPVFVVAIDKDQASAIEGLSLFRSYTTGINDEFKDVTIVEAARATTAAPTYFKAQAIKSKSGAVKHFVSRDGGLGHNNPVFSVLDEAERNYPCAEIGCVISIGTGVQDKLKLAVEGGARHNLFKIPIIGKLAAILDTGIVAAALATSSEGVHHFAQSRFRNTGVYYRFNFPNDAGIKLFDYQKLDTLKEDTNKYLDEYSTHRLLKKCVTQLQKLDDPANYVKIRNKRRLYSKPDDRRSMMEPTMNPELIGQLLRMPDQNTIMAVNIPPESLWTDVDSYKTIPLRNWARSGEVTPVGHLGMSFNVLRGGEPPNRTYLKPGSHRPRLCRFPVLEVGDGQIIPSGRWRATMIFRLQGTDASENLRQKCMQITLSVYVLDEDDVPTIGADDGPVVSATAISVPVTANCAQWEEVVASESFEVLEGEQVIFELGWELELAGAEFAESSSLLFGGIRLTAED
ncbi:acyl transferase/acyl hydrolase/lysophospholipase [Geopyxis carbonaria]|nr:acyl transferase/acyl hydrolase/lysophospholipase [Geopyxis carbonaria]